MFSFSTISRYERRKSYLISESFFSHHKKFIDYHSRKYFHSNRELYSNRKEEFEYPHQIFNYSIWKRFFSTNSNSGDKNEPLINNKTLKDPKIQIELLSSKDTTPNKISNLEKESENITDSITYQNTIRDMSSIKNNTSELYHLENVTKVKGFDLFTSRTEIYNRSSSNGSVNKIVTELEKRRGLEELTEFASKSILLPHLSNLKKATFSNNIKISIIQAWHSIMMSLLPLGNASLENKVEIYTNGDDAFEKMWDSIQNSKEEILYETYIVKPDLVGMKTITLLAEAARRGVKVTFIYDYIGSSLYIGNNHLQIMIDSGVNVISFNPLLPRFFNHFNGVKSQPILFRNHRKILVVDKKVGYCGGLNTSSDYAGTKYGISRFRDTHMKIEGPAVQDLVEVFSDSYQEATLHLSRKKSGESLKKMINENELIQTVKSNLKSEKIFNIIKNREIIQDKSISSNNVKEIFESLKAEVSKNWKLRLDRYKTRFNEITHHEKDESNEMLKTLEKETQGIFAQVLSSNVLRNKIHLQNAVIEIIRNSGREVLITNPFLLPPKRISNALISAANRGVKVRIITSGKSDTPFMRWASTHIYHEYLKHSNIEIYEYQTSILHAKTVTVDGLFCSVGSFNFDLLSGFRNLEVNVTFIDSNSAKQLESQFYIDLKESRQVTLQSLSERKYSEKLLHWFCYSVSRLVSLLL